MTVLNTPNVVLTAWMPSPAVVDPLADFDHDNDVDFDDFTLFAQAWRDVDIMRDIGPTTGSPPDLDPAFDGVLDFEDLATFVVMWHWSHDHGIGN